MIIVIKRNRKKKQRETKKKRDTQREKEIEQSISMNTFKYKLETKEE